ncbi:hypothetical protein BKH43_01545 [Helicobacter sp. 13S00401-1]|nr:hypothetical protein BKH43_01545 [Helicobacter sp. 13S00401-1]
MLLKSSTQLMISQKPTSKLNLENGGGGGGLCLLLFLLPFALIKTPSFFTQPFSKAHLFLRKFLKKS